MSPCLTVGCTGRGGSFLPGGSEEEGLVHCVTGPGLSVQTDAAPTSSNQRQDAGLKPGTPGLAGTALPFPKVEAETI